eukprot:GEMP01035148.1.p1 GENE.GEMP01035148.1~~GEMP01035148.1.p1  ORF type:complete len:487 (+),score=105.39 GEMP01035148.1:268-1728(+)
MSHEGKLSKFVRRRWLYGIHPSHPVDFVDSTLNLGTSAPAVAVTVRRQETKPSDLLNIDHPCIVRVFDSTEEEDIFHTVMERVDFTLQDFLRNEDESLHVAPLSRDCLCEAYACLLRGLTEWHTNVASHGNIGLTNIMRCSGMWKLTTSPFDVASDNQGIRSDVWNLGFCFLLMALGPDCLSYLVITTYSALVDSVKALGADGGVKPWILERADDVDVVLDPDVLNLIVDMLSSAAICFPADLLDRKMLLPYMNPSEFVPIWSRICVYCEKQLRQVTFFPSGHQVSCQLCADARFVVEGENTYYVPGYDQPFVMEWTHPIEKFTWNAIQGGQATHWTIRKRLANGDALRRCGDFTAALNIYLNELRNPETEVHGWEGIGSVAFTLGHFSLARSLCGVAGFGLFFHAIDSSASRQQLYIMAQKALETTDETLTVLALCAIGEVYRIGHIQDDVTAAGYFTEAHNMNGTEFFAKTRLKLSLKSTGRPT